jgi:UDP:flavonoid glycosyltransferase YjiC (YdhE family)
MVGPVSARPSSPVIPDPAIAAFAAEAAAEDGLVLISFGSVSSFFGSLLTKEDYVNLALAFADLAPVRVLWLLNPRGLPEGVTVEGLPLGNNTLMVPWGPINDVLGHPSCRAFVTHGGER